MVQWITGEIHLDGFQILRTCDITGIEVLERRARYLRKVLALRGEKVSRPRKVDLEDWPAILRWAGSRFPLIVVHQEFTDPNVCHVGQISSASDVTLTMRTIDECGRWDPKPWRCRMRTITRLDFGGDYEGALALVSGTEADPKPSGQRRRSKS